MGDNNPRALSIAANAGFVVTGVVSTLLGALLPAFAARWALDDSHSGYLFTTQFAGSMTGVAFSNTVARRFGISRSIAVGFGLMSVGVAALDNRLFGFGLIAAFVCGAGLGITIPGTNLLVSGINPHRSAQNLNILNFMWGAGAVIGPASVGQIAFRFDLRWALYLVSFIVALLVLVWSAIKPPAISSKAPVQAFPRLETEARARLAALIGGFVFLYIGTENAISGWISSQGTRLAGAGGISPGMFPSVFFCALLLGRLLAPVMLRLLRPERLTLVGLIVAVPGIVVLTWTGAASVLLAGIFITGFGLGPVFPNTVALLSQAFGSAPTRVSSAIFALAGLGGATIPWLVGVVSSHYQSLATGLAVALIGNVGIIALQFLLMASERTLDSRRGAQ